jgi:hypothetical protein
MNSRLDKVLLITIVISFTIVILGIIYNYNKTDSKPNNNFIEEQAQVQIDNSIKANDSIKLEVKQLNDIKNAKIIEVSTLDNDSTIKLFYKLVQE